MTEERKADVVRMVAGLLEPFEFEEQQEILARVADRFVMGLVPKSYFEIATAAARDKENERLRAELKRWTDHSCYPRDGGDL